MSRTSTFDGALAKLNSRTVTARTSAEALSKQLYAAADVLYSVRGSVRSVTTDGLNDAKEGYAFRLGPIPEGNSVALGLVTELRRAAQDWDQALGKVADDMEWLGKMLGKFPKTSAVKMINFRTRSLGEGVTTEAFVKALEECVKVLLGNTKEAKAVLKIVAAEVKDPMGLFQHEDVMLGAKELLERQGAWETRTKSLAEGCKALVTALKTKTASKRDLYTEALAKLASMDDAKRSRFEEGKPADPTENMGPEDAKKWREENEKNRDNFKSAAKANVGRLSLKASIFDEALLKLSAKKPTFAEVRTVIFEKLKKEGWKLQESLKVPHATSPDGKTRLWFKAQAVYGNATGTDPRQFKNTQSWTSDLREYADPEAFMRMVERWRSKD